MQGGWMVYKPNVHWDSVRDTRHAASTRYRMPNLPMQYPVNLSTSTKDIIEEIEIKLEALCEHIKG